MIHGYKTQLKWNEKYNLYFYMNSIFFKLVKYYVLIENQTNFKLYVKKYIIYMFLNGTYSTLFYS